MQESKKIGGEKRVEAYKFKAIIIVGFESHGIMHTVWFVSAARNREKRFLHLKFAILNQA